MLVDWKEKWINEIGIIVNMHNWYKSIGKVSNQKSWNKWYWINVYIDGYGWMELVTLDWIL